MVRVHFQKELLTYCFQNCVAFNMFAKKKDKKLWSVERGQCALLLKTNEIQNNVLILYLIPVQVIIFILLLF